MRVSVLIRVYDRIEDLENNLQIIRKTWLSNEYDIMVVSNGSSDGYNLTNYVYTLADNIVELHENIGHLQGNSQLLISACEHVDFSRYDYVIILEADTWIYSDAIINKYIYKLKECRAVWASARWYDRFYSLATDFAIIDANFLSKNYGIFNFGLYPECFVANYLHERNYKYLWITENQNVQIPGYLKKLPYAPKGRFYCFPASKMVTHHIEHYTDGMHVKKQHFNCICGFKFFDVNTPFMYIRKYLMMASHFFDKLCIRRSWYSKRIYMDISNGDKYRKVFIKV